MIKERRDIVNGVMNAILIMKLPIGESFEAAIVFYGKDDNVTIEEAREIVRIERDEERVRLMNVLNNRLFQAA